MSANVCPWASDEKPTDPVAPPRLIVTILPLAWHVLMSCPTEAQFGRLVPGNVALSVGLQVWRRAKSQRRSRQRNTPRTFAKLIDGTPPGPENTFRNDTGNASMASSWPGEISPICYVSPRGVLEPT